MGLEDNWVLQTVQGTKPPQIALSQDKNALVTHKVQELLFKKIIVQTAPSPISYIPRFFCSYIRRVNQSVINLKAFNQFV